MAKLIILGSSNAIPDENHENTHMALVAQDRVVMIDCVNTPVVRLRQAGLDHLQVSDLILTHFHPDHVSGVPSFLMNSWLLGRRTSLKVYGLKHTLDRVQALMDFYEWSTWPNFFPVHFYPIPEEEMATVLDDEDFHIYSSPVHHFIPTIGLRVEFQGSGRVMAYSGDTEPCDEVVRLAGGADVLFHEAAGATLGHSSAAQAGAIARDAEAGRLYLIHYRTGGYDPQPLLQEARQTYLGPVELAVDFLELEL